jgi:hypothetical protein
MRIFLAFMFLSLVCPKEWRQTFSTLHLRLPAIHTAHHGRTEANAKIENGSLTRRSGM